MYITQTKTRNKVTFFWDWKVTVVEPNGERTSFVFTDEQKPKFLNTLSNEDKNFDLLLAAVEKYKTISECLKLRSILKRNPINA